MGKMGRERPTKRPVFGSDLPPPPRPPGPGPPGQPGFGQRPGGSATLDREHTGSKPAEPYRSHNTSEVRRWSRDNKFPPAPPVPPTPPPPAANLQKRPPAPPAPPVPPAPPAPPAPKRRNNSDRVEPREQPKKKQRFPPPPLPPAPPAPPAPRAPPAPPAPPAPIVNDYDDNDYDGEYYEAWDDGYGPVGWDDGYGEKQATHLEYFTSDEDESMDGADDEVSPTLSYLPPPPPPPPGDSRDFIPPPPPQVPKDFKGWGKGGKFSRRKMASTNSPWFCNVCNKDFWSEDKYKMHVQDDHIPCPEEGCTFSGPEFVMAVHKLKHVKAADGSSVTDSPEELAAWRSMRRANFPSRGNMQRKADLEEKRRLSGALPDPPKVSMLEKLLRRTQIDKGKGFSSKGFGKKGKFKGKGKDGKGFGKEGKGKDWKGKDGKGKGKFSGKKGKGKNKWAMDLHKELPERHHDHATYSVPLPSVVANCVPLEAPFGTPSAQPSTTPDPPKWGLCRFFERGFCFHGENCQYEHVGSPQVVNATAWWALPSSLANRAGRPGEGPSGGVFGSLRSRAIRATRVEPYMVMEQRERRDGLLRRLLQPDMERYYSAILQCVRYIVSTDFLRLERPHVERDVQQPGPSKVERPDPQAEMDAEVLREDFDDIDMSNLGALLRGDTD